MNRATPDDPASATPASGPDVPPAALIDLLGVLAYGELSGFDRLADDARLAPTLDGRAAMSHMAAQELLHHELLATRLRELGADPSEAMEPFVAALDGFHATTAPTTWLEGLVKAYVGDGLAADFYREVATLVDESTRELVTEVLSDTGSGQFAVREVRAAIEADPTLRGRLSLWARRLVGEAISQAQYVAAERDALTELIVTAGDLAGVAELITRITDRHAARMDELGLSS